MRSWRQNVIVSHGGRHGAHSRTFRKGTTVARDAAAVIPDSVLGQATAAAEDVPPAPRPLPRGAEPGDHPAKRKLAEAAREERGEILAPIPTLRQEEAPPPPPSEPAPAPKVEESVAGDEPTDPKSKRALALMRKTEVEALAAKHGIEVETGTKGRTQMLRDLLAIKLGL